MAFDPCGARGAAPRGRGLLRRLVSRGDGLLEVFQAELQLVGVEPLRAPAELPALQLPDQEAQLVDFGLGRVTLPANQVAFGESGIPLGQNSIALDLEGSDPGALAGDDFHHLLQLP